jgi:hypothetical protein
LSLENIEQKKWIEFREKRGRSYRPVDWALLGLIIFDRRGAKQELRLYGASEARLELLGAVELDSQSATGIRRLVGTEQSRWFKAWPELDGAYRPEEEAQAFVDLNKAHSIGRRSGGPDLAPYGDVFFLELPGAPPCAVVENREKVRLAQKLEDSLKS